MTCPDCAARGWDHEQVVKDCLKSPWHTGVILGNYDWFLNPLHEALNEWYVNRYNEGKRRFVIMLPRGTMKTHLFGISNIVWLLLKDAEKRILYTMASGTEATKTMRAVQRIFQSDKMRHFFPKRWLNTKGTEQRGTSEFMELERTGNYRESSLQSIGVGSTITGGHFTDQVFDDLIDKTMMGSDAQQESVISFFRDATNMFVDSEKDLRIVLGTLWEGTFYEWLLEESGIIDLYESLILGARVDSRYREFLSSIGKRSNLKDGAPIWPERLSEQKLSNILIEQGPAFFARQYLNLKGSSEDKLFDKGDFLFYEFADDKYVLPMGNNRAKIPISRLYRSIVVDPATGENKQTDDSAISCVGIDRETGYAFVLDEWAGKVKPLALCDQIIAMAKRWKPHVVGIEEASFQAVLKNFLRQRMTEKGAAFSVKPVKPFKRSKITRLAALQPYVKNGQVFFLKNHQKLMHELTGLQVVRGKLISRSPNRADALAYHVDFWKGIAPKTSSTREDDEIEEVDSFPMFPQRSYGLECAT